MDLFNLDFDFACETFSTTLKRYETVDSSRFWMAPRSALKLFTDASAASTRERAPSPLRSRTLPRWPTRYRRVAKTPKALASKTKEVNLSLCNASHRSYSHFLWTTLWRSWGKAGAWPVIPVSVTDWTENDRF